MGTNSPMGDWVSCSGTRIVQIYADGNRLRFWLVHLMWACISRRQCLVQQDPLHIQQCVVGVLLWVCRDRDGRTVAVPGIR
jgi:hypothetical protein